MVIRTRFASCCSVPAAAVPAVTLTYAVQRRRDCSQTALSELSGWLKLLAAYDIVFLGLASLLFPHTVDE